MYVSLESSCDKLFKNISKKDQKTEISKNKKTFIRVSKVKILVYSTCVGF
jgi:hypothetical protein